MIQHHDPLLLELLNQIELFRALDDEERTYLISKMQLCSFKRGEVLIQQNSELDQIFLIASGLVTVVREDEDGVPTEVAQLGKGALVGELSLLTNSLPNANVIAMLDSEAWVLSHDDFQALLLRSIPLALTVNRSLSAKLAATNERLVPQRMAHYSAFIGDRHSPHTRSLSLEVAQSIARYTQERVLLVDCFPQDNSPLSDEPSWGEAADQLLRDSSALTSHTAPADLTDPRSCVRVIRHSNDPESKADPAALLSLVTRLRNLYTHIIFDLPTDHPTLLADLLPTMDKVVATFHRDRLRQIGEFLHQPEVASVQPHGLLVVTGWPRSYTMGDIWDLEERYPWKIGALISETERPKGVDQVARVLTNLRVGIAWGGGTARGWALAGIVEALEALQVPMDMFAGTSAGALGAAVYGLSLDYREADQQMRAVLPYLKRTTRPFPPVRLSRHSLLAESWWNNLITTFLAEKTFSDMRLPFAAVALDLTTGEQAVFTRGRLWEAIRASSSIPMLAPPTMIDGRPYADGGVVNAVPLDVVSDMGADILIGIDLTGSENSSEWGDSSKPHMISTFLRTLNVAYNTAASRTIPLADVIIRPSLRSAAIYDVTVMDNFIAEGRRATLDALPKLRRVMPWLLENSIGVSG